MISIEWQTVLDSEDEVMVRNKGPANHDHDILVWISIVENSLHVIRSISSGKKNGPSPEVICEIQRLLDGVFFIFIVGHAWFDQVDVAETELFGLATTAENYGPGPSCGCPGRCSRGSDGVRRAGGRWHRLRSS